MNKNYIKTALSALLASMVGAFLAFLRTEALGISPFPLFYFISLGAIAVFLVLGSFIKADKIKLSSLSESELAECRYSTVRTVISVISASFVALAAVFLYILGSRGVTDIILCVFMLICTICTLLRIKKSDCAEICGIPSLFPIFFLCIFLLFFYRENAKTAPLSNYAPEALTLIFLILSAYFDSAVHFGVGKRTARCGFALVAFAFAVFELVSYLIDPASVSCVAPLPFILFSFGFSVYPLVSLPFPDTVIFNTKE